jgi:hypothetical protein
MKENKDTYQRRLSLNRAAAMRCRMKKKAEITRLSGIVEELTATNRQLQSQLQTATSLLRSSTQENLVLKSQLAHLWLGLGRPIKVL